MTRGAGCVGAGWGGRDAPLVQRGGQILRSARVPGSLLPLPLLLLLLSATTTNSIVPRLSTFAHWGMDEKARSNTNMDELDKALQAAGVERPLPSSDSSSPTNLRFSTQQSAGETTGAPGIKGGGDCLGLVRKNCGPCPSPEQNTAGAAGGCELIDAQCDNLFCDPLCLNRVIDCKIVGVSDAQFKEIGTKEIEAALCSEFKAHACSKAKCCDKDDSLLQSWVEEDAYGDSFPKPLMLIEACKHNPLDGKQAKKICDDCKKAVKGKIKVKPFKPEDVCTPLNSYFGDLKDPMGEKDDDPNSWTPYNVKFGWPFIGQHQMFKQRCERLVEKMEGHLSGLKSVFEETACNCLGCCDPVNKCWFPIVESPE